MNSNESSVREEANNLKPHRGSLRVRKPVRGERECALSGSEVLGKQQPRAGFSRMILLNTLQSSSSGGQEKPLPSSPVGV